MTGPQPHRPAPPAQMRLGIWGPPSSGKSTFLAALKIATFRSRLPGNWIMNGADPESVRFLQDSLELLTERRIFPPMTDDHKPMLFRFTGEQTVRVGRFPRSSETIQRDAFELDVLDVPGRIFAPLSAEERASEDYSDIELPDVVLDSPRGTGGDNEQLINHLQMCHGIVYLFDPQRDARAGDAFKYFHSVLEELAARVMQSAHPGSRLPHWMAVCITKFDQPYVYEMARKGGLTIFDGEPPYCPRVDDWAASEFFTRLSENDSANTDLVAGALEKYFFQDRVRYFVSSSVGFYTANGRFRMNDYSNIDPSSPGGDRIRGKIHPINVLEPLIWLHHSLRGIR